MLQTLNAVQGVQVVWSRCNTACNGAASGLAPRMFMLHGNSYTVLLRHVCTWNSWHQSYGECLISVVDTQVPHDNDVPEDDNGSCRWCHKVQLHAHAIPVRKAYMAAESAHPCTLSHRAT